MGVGEWRFGVRKQMDVAAWRSGKPGSTSTEPSLRLLGFPPRYTSTNHDGSIFWKTVTYTGTSQAGSSSPTFHANSWRPCGGFSNGSTPPLSSARSFFNGCAFAAKGRKRSGHHAVLIWPAIKERQAERRARPGGDRPHRLVLPGERSHQAGAQ